MIPILPQASKFDSNWYPKSEFIYKYVSRWSHGCKTLWEYECLHDPITPPLLLHFCWGWLAILLQRGLKHTTWASVHGRILIRTFSDGAWLRGVAVAGSLRAPSPLRICHAGAAFLLVPAHGSAARGSRAYHLGLGARVLVRAFSGGAVAAAPGHQQAAQIRRRHGTPGRPTPEPPGRRPGRPPGQPRPPAQGATVPPAAAGAWAAEHRTGHQTPADPADGFFV